MTLFQFAGIEALKGSENECFCLLRVWQHQQNEWKLGCLTQINMWKRTKSTQLLDQCTRRIWRCFQGKFLVLSFVDDPFDGLTSSQQPLLLLLFHLLLLFLLLLLLLLLQLLFLHLVHCLLWSPFTLTFLQDLAAALGCNLGLGRDFKVGPKMEKFDSTAKPCTKVGGIMDEGGARNHWSPCSVEDLSKYIKSFKQFCLKPLWSFQWPTKGFAPLISHLQALSLQHN